jgi:hypothetical protein
MDDSKATATTTALATPNDQPTLILLPTANPRFEGKSYLKCLKSLENAFPALKSFLEKLADENDSGRKVVKQHYQREHQRGPGRCYCLKFEESSVCIVKEDGFESPAALRKYLEKNPARRSREVEKHRRLFILEDMEPDYVDALGHHLGVDPLVFSEHMNTWNFTDSWSIPHRGLPSMSVPEQSFTLRYYELRTLFDPESIGVFSSQATFAVNKRRYERWRDIDVPSTGKPDRRHAFVRRCASFWTSQDPTPKVENLMQKIENPTKKIEDPTKKKGDPRNDTAGWDGKLPKAQCIFLGTLLTCSSRCSCHLGRSGIYCYMQSASSSHRQYNTCYYPFGKSYADNGHESKQHPYSGYNRARCSHERWCGGVPDPKGSNAISR